MQTDLAKGVSIMKRKPIFLCVFLAVVFLLSPLSVAADDVETTGSAEIETTDISVSERAKVLTNLSISTAKARF